MNATSGALARSAVPGLNVRTVPVSATVDPLALLQGFPTTRGFCWEQPSRGLAIAGVGASVTITAAGRDRFARCAAALADVLAAAPDAVAVGGFAFRDDERQGAPWRGFPSTEWIVPEVALVRRAGRAQLVATAPHGAAGRSLDLILARARTALVRPLEGADPPPAYHAIGSPAVAWRRAVEATLADIAAGRLAKLVLARAAIIRAAAPFDPLRTLARLRRAYPGCTLFAVGRGDATFVGASPERLARVTGDRLDTAAVAGTAPRGQSPQADRALARALAADPKERGEHALVIDGIRDRLGALADDIAARGAPGSLATETVQHLHTPVRAHLRSGRGLLDVVAALHPTPAVCGTPRAAAQAALRAREHLARGWYAGGVGWLDAGGGEVTVALRTALLRGPEAVLHAGAGIVAGSTWDAELEETRLKMRPLLAALLEL